MEQDYGLEKNRIESQGSLNIKCQQVPDGFTSWIKFLLQTQEELMFIVSTSNFHVLAIDKQRYDYAVYINNLLSSNDVYTAIQEYKLTPNNIKYKTMN